MALSYQAGAEGQARRTDLRDGAFPFQQFREDAARYAADRVKGNLSLDRKYAPLLLELLDGNFTNVKPGRSPYSGREQLAVKVSLGGGLKAEGGAFGRALLFADNSGFEYVNFPAGLTLEVGLPDGKGDGPRQALQEAGVRDQLLDALLAPLPTATLATLTLNTDFGGLKLLPLREAQREEVAGTVAAYAQGFGKSRRLRVGLTLTPADLESPVFLELLGAALVYMDDLMSVLERLARAPEPERHETALIEVPGRADEGPSLLFTPIPGVPLNQILYGPPGTGKTYRVVDEALSVLDPAFLKANPGAEGRAARKGRYDQLVEQGRVSFVTFHQSFGYEDFIEGIKPVMRAGQLSYQLHDGVFLNAVRAAGGPLAPVEEQAEAPAAPVSGPGAVRPDGQVWRIYIDGAAPVSQLRERSVARSEIRMGSWLQASTPGASGISSGPTRPVDLNSLSEEQLSAQQHAFKDSMREGDVVLLATGQDRIGAVGVVTGGYRFDPSSDPVFALDYAHARPVRWLAKGLSLSAQEVTGKLFAQQTLQRVAGATPAQVLAHLDLREEASTPSSAAMQPHVLIIDEINRGNVSKIFGELITLLEAGKRAGSSEALTATLPLSRRALSVPQSLYVIGTMNTADRSLTLLDAALRRRFVFRPVWPEPEVLPVIEIGGDALDLRKFLYVINERIERLLSREQVIGHAYLLGLPATLEGVASALRERILPLLEEYFFEDWSKIRTVLADDSKEEAQQFIQVHKAGGELRYRVNEAAFEDIEAFTLVYSNMKDADFPFRS
ncbi:AAA family ATPase [Deinococcus sp. 14RED07]|uniref:AAA family ATPase n=1 Tax=Deinococcus sp. 14RED07 TaxID=2745874 RepID=UPI001E4ADE79|nr:AAA family ATPase [Deinococcus sp. 14RED07]